MAKRLSYPEVDLPATRLELEEANKKLGQLRKSKSSCANCKFYQPQSLAVKICLLKSKRIQPYNICIEHKNESHT